MNNFKYIVLKRSLYILLFTITSSFGQNIEGQLLKRYEANIKCSQNNLQGLAHEALKCSQEALSIANLLNDNKKKLEALFYITNSFEGLGQYQAAFEHAYEGLKLSDETEDFFAKAKFESLCGILNLSLNKPDDALPYLESALDYYELTNNITNKYITLGNITNAYSMKSNYLKAKPILKAIKHHYLNEKDTINYIISVHNLADLYKNTKETDSALIEIEHLKNYKLNKNFSLSTFLLKGEIYYGVKNYDTAIFYLKKANKIAQNLNDYVQEELITKTLASSYGKINDYQQASFYYQRNAQLKDSILTVKSQERIQELETLYQVDKKEKEIVQLLKIKEKRSRQITWLVILLFFIGIILLLVYFKTRAKIKYARLTNDMLSQELTHKKMN